MNNCFIVAFPKGFKITSLELSRVGQLDVFSEMKDKFELDTTTLFSEFKRALSVLRKKGILPVGDSYGFEIMVEYCRKNGYLISEHAIPSMPQTIVNITSTKAEKNRLKKIIKSFN